MNDTPIPIDLDNFPLNEALRFADENSTTGGLVTQAALKTLASGCRELTAAREELKAVTEQRDRLAEELKETKKHLKDANRGAEINAHALRINADKLIAVTEQRDEYKIALQSADNHNHEIATKLEIVTEQRDRLAEALKDALYDLETSDGLMACDNEEGHSLFCLEQRSIPKARQALQSLKQT